MKHTRPGTWQRQLPRVDSEIIRPQVPGRGRLNQKTESVNSEGREMEHNEAQNQWQFPKKFHWLCRQLIRIGDKVKHGEMEGRDWPDIDTPEKWAATGRLDHGASGRAVGIAKQRAI